MASFVWILCFFFFTIVTFGQETLPQENEITLPGTPEEAQVEYLEEEQQQQPTKTGAVYTRWGKSTCPYYIGTVLVYPGVVGGARTHEAGGGSGFLCMPYDPQFSKNKLPHQNRSGVYGTEYRVEHLPFTLPYKGITSLRHQDAPCAVCMSISRNVSVMIPGRHDCYSGWTQEYTGYVMTGQKTDWGRMEYVCVDKDPDALPGGFLAENGSVFVPVEARCGSLPCPPYADGYEITCVVCTKE